MSNNFGFNPAMVLDPITMRPMMSGGSITVNPMGMPVRVEQKPWQKMLLNNIPQEMPDDLVKRILQVVGNLRSYKRSETTRGKLVPFCIFEFDTGEDIMRASKFLSSVKILDRHLELKTSPETENFIKQWMTIQKEEWKKKLLCKESLNVASAMNEAKQYASLQKYLERDDDNVAQKLQKVIASVNVDLKKIIQQKQREDERKEHPREKERDKKKKQFREELDRKFNSNLEYWLGREKEKDREYRKEREKERDREKIKQKRLERQMDIESDEQARRISKFFTAQRKKMREKELQNDAEREIEWMPPEPAMAIEVNAPQEPAPDDVEVDERVKQANNRPRFNFTRQEEQIPKDRWSDRREEPALLHFGNGHKDRQHEQSEKRQGLFHVEDDEPQAKPRSYNLKLPKVNPESQNNQSNRKQQEEMQKRLAQLFRQVPQNKSDLWNYHIDWQLLSKSVIIQRKIRPWLNKKSIEHMGEIETNFINMIENQLVKRSYPEKIIKRLSDLLGDETEEFVIKLWKVLIFEQIKLQNGVTS